MNATAAVMNRELKGYFGTPVAYVFLVVFLFLSSFMAFKNQLFELRDANLRVFFAGFPALFAFFAPAIAMRMWADERRSGTIELLLTLPITVKQAVLGKFFAGWMFFAIALFLTTPIVLTICYLGDPDYGPIFTGYLGALLMAGAFLAIGCFFSTVTKNQAIAWVLGVVVCGLFVVAGLPSILGYVSLVFGSGVAGFLEQLSFTTHYEAMQRGVLEFRNLFFLVAVAVGFVISSIVMLDEKKAS